MKRVLVRGGLTEYIPFSASHSWGDGEGGSVMKRIRVLATVLVLSCSLLFLNACASSEKKLLKGIPSVEPIKVCRYETPGIMKSTGTETALLAAITAAAPGGTALLLLGDEYNRARASGTQSKIPDFGALVMDKFVERVKTARPDWPQLSVIPTPLQEDFSEKCTVVEFKVSRVAYGSLDLTRGGVVFERGLDKGLVSTGFLSKTMVTMKDSEGEVIWQKSYIYLSDNFSREKSLDELEADEYKLLKEEMVFAAEKTAEDFVEHLIGEKKKEPATQ
jgi:hypothetical protein